MAREGSPTKTLGLFLFTVIAFMAITANSAPRGTKVISKPAKDSLDDNLGSADEQYTSYKKTHPKISLNSDLDCSERYNNSINALEKSLVDIGNSTTAGSEKNTTAYIQDWVTKAEKDRETCLSTLKNAASTYFAIPSYLPFVLMFLPVIFCV